MVDTRGPDDRSPDPLSCLPPGFARTDDGGFQDIVASGPLEVDNSSTVDMRGTTDHPGLLVDLRARPRHRP